MIFNALRAVRDASAPKPLPVSGERKHLVETAAYWFNAARHHQNACRMADALLCMENAYNHVENALSAKTEPKPVSGESSTPWTIETMRMINLITPDVNEKAFDPDWFLLRQRFETIEQELAEAQQRWIAFLDSAEGRNLSASQQRDTANRLVDELQAELATALDANRRANAAIGDIANECATERAARAETVKAYETVKAWAHRLEANLTTLINQCDQHADGTVDATPLGKFSNELIGLSNEISFGKVLTLKARAESAEAKLQAQSMAYELASALTALLNLPASGDNAVIAARNGARSKAREVLARFEAANKPDEK